MNNGNTKKNTLIFISHDHADKDVAGKFMDYLLSSVDVKEESIICTSQPGRSVPVGEVISYKLKENLIKSGVVFVLVTKKSIASVWVMVEMAAAWVLSKKLIFILAPGIEIDDLPAPIGEYKLILCQNKDNARTELIGAVKDVSKEIGVKELDDEKKIGKLDGFLNEYCANKNKIRYLIYGFSIVLLIALITVLALNTKWFDKNINLTITNCQNLINENLQIITDDSVVRKDTTILSDTFKARVKVAKLRGEISLKIKDCWPKNESKIAYDLRNGSNSVSISGTESFNCHKNIFITIINCKNLIGKNIQILTDDGNVRKDTIILSDTFKTNVIVDKISGVISLKIKDCWQKNESKIAYDLRKGRDLVSINSRDIFDCSKIPTESTAKKPMPTSIDSAGNTR